MGVSNNTNNFEFENLNWWINKKSGNIQIYPKVSLDKLYFKSHGSGTVGKTWKDHHDLFFKLVNKYLIGTGLNSLGEIINFMKISVSLKFNKFLIMPPAYYKYGDIEVIDFYSRIVDAVPESKIILYNFEKLCGYKFSISCIEKLVKKFPEQIVGVKDSTYNLYQSLKIENFSIFPGSELKLLEGLEAGCDGIITATCNVTAELSRKVYDDFFLKNKQSHNQKLCDVRRVFDQFNLISAIHTFMAKDDSIYKNLLPPLSLLNKKDKDKIITDLNDLNFYFNSRKAA